MGTNNPISGSSRRQLRPRFASTALVLLTLLFLTVLPGQAQVLYGSLTGNVTDSSGAAIPNATVQALNTATGVAQTVTTDSSGSYRFNALQSGPYKITISAASFAAKVFDRVDVANNLVRRADAQLGIAAQQQSVEVTGEAPLLQTDKSDVHSNLSNQQVEQMPTAGTQGRNFQSLLRIIPGTGLTAETNSLSGNPMRAINTNVNGQSNQSVNTRIDGAQDAYPWLPANVAYVPPADAIQEVNVVTNSFDAEQGMAGGAAVNVQVKSGTNAFHGSAHEFHTDQNFAAKTYFQTPTTHKNRNNQNQFGGTFGGPIKKDKLFFFADYERTTQRGKAGPVFKTLPTSNLAIGDFRNLPGNPIIYDPATGDAHGNGKTQISCNGVLNVICPARIDPAAAAMIGLLKPVIGQEFTTPNGLNNFAGSGTALFNRDNVDTKINYVPTTKSTLFGRYSFSKVLVFDPPLLGDAGGDATNGGQLGSAPGLIQSIGLGATYAFTPNLLLDWNAGYTRQRLAATFDLGSPKGLDLLKIPGTNGAAVPGDTTDYNGLPAFQINSGSSSTNLGNPNTGNPFVFRDNQYVSGMNLSWTHGRHNVRGGIEFNDSQINHFQPQGAAFQTPRGTFQFTGNVTSLPIDPITGKATSPTWFNSFADFLLGLPTATGKAYQITNPIAVRWKQWAWYLRDQFQVTQKLTLNLGVRWEYYPFGYSDNGKGLRWFNPADGNVYIGGYGSVPQNDNIDVGHGQLLPRVGIAWRLTSSTVVRAGYGMSADPNTFHTFRNAYPSTVISNNVLKTASDFIPVASLTGLNGTGLASGAVTVPTGLVNLSPPNLSTGIIPLPTSAGTVTIPNPFHRGYINSFNFTVEQELKGFVLQTGYVGARDVRPLVQMNLNGSPPGTGAAGGPISIALGKTYTGNINGLVPFKSSSYDSLQTRITRRFANGSNFGFVWTWSKALDYSDNDDLQSLFFPNPTGWAWDHSYAGFDRTHNFEIYGVLQLPFGKGQRWVNSGIGSRILGGWQFSPIISKMSGFPFTVTGSGSSLNAFGAGNNTANLVAPLHVVNGTPPNSGQSCAAADLSCHFFDPTAFAQPAAGTYGNTRRNQFRGPGYFSMNLSVARQFKLTERFALQIRADAIGFTNTPHFNNPNASCCGTNFGVITSVVQPGGFFGPDPGNRVVWLAARLTF